MHTVMVLDEICCGLSRCSASIHIVLVLCQYDVYLMWLGTPYVTGSAKINTEVCFIYMLVGKMLFMLCQC